MKSTRPITAAALAVSGVLFVVIEIVHPHEYALDHERAQLATIADSVTRWQVVHALTFLVLLLAAVYIVGLAIIVGGRLGVAAGVLGVFGAMGFMAVDAVDGYTWGVLGTVAGRRGVDQHTLQVTLHEVQNNGWQYVFALLSLGLIAGALLLAYGLARDAIVPRAAIAVWALGTFLIGLDPVFHTSGWYIASAAIAAVGALMVAAALRAPPPARPSTA